MGHSLGVDAHYISRNPEVHRAEYKKGYPELRILEPLATDEMKAIQEKLQKKDEQIQNLIGEMHELKRNSEIYKQIVAVLRIPERLKQFEKWISEEKAEP
jgi:2-hydroxy-3-keto-5-methylthiopentenyl-1-phosphate phosphatase